MTATSQPERLSDVPAQPPPAAPEAEHVLEHEYDGILEYDNPLPRWWVLSFWASFVFSLGYLFHYHLSGRGLSVADGYEREMSAAREERAQRSLGETVSEPALEKLMQDPALMADAMTLFGQRCAPCHGDRGQGLIGPNLTDEYWLHGRGALMHIYESVSRGIPEKGMPAWEAQLSAIELRKLAALIGSFRGRNLPGKPAQGERIAGP